MLMAIYSRSSSVLVCPEMRRLSIMNGIWFYEYKPVLGYVDIIRVFLPSPGSLECSLKSLAISLHYVYITIVL